MNASSLQDGAGRKGPEREALSVKGRRRRKGKSPAGMPRQRPIGRNAHYEESFLTAQQVICRCREKSDEPFLAAQVIILQQLMQRDQLAEGSDSLNAGRPLDSRRWNNG